MKPTLPTVPFGRFYLFVLLFISSYSLVLAQNPTPSACGTDDVHRSRMATDSTYRNFVLKIKQQVADKVAAKAFDGTTYTIPVVFVVYHLGEAVGTGTNVSDAALQAQVDLMNQMYAGSSATYPAPRANIQFTLARRTPDCQAFSGIVRVDGRSVADYQTTGVNGSDSQENALRQLSGMFSTSSTDNFVVIRVVHNITFAAGYAYFGGDMFVEAGGMTSASTYNKLLSHEMGHVLFLDHTFNGSETSTPSSYTCPANANPAVDGDAVADTDPHKQNEPANCFYQATPISISAINSCTGQPFGWIGNNIMAYGCYSNQFTQGQIDRMRSFLTTDNLSLGLSNYGTAPATNEGITAAACSVTTVNSNPAGYYTGISRFRFNTIDKSSKSYAYYSGYYQNYGCTDRTTVTAGNSYTFSMSASYFPTIDYRRIYIDYNNDGSFNENTELAFSSTDGASSGTILIPTTAVQNVTLRMRVVVDNGSAATPPTACLLPGSTTYGYGEIEDYGLLIQGSVCQSATATLAGSQIITPNQTASLTATLTGSSPWSLTLNTGQVFTNVSSSPFAFTVAPTATTTYSVVALSNGCGSGSVSGIAVVTVVASNTCTAPTNLTQTNQAAEYISFNWSEVPGAAGYQIRWKESSTTVWNSFTTCCSGVYNTSVVYGRTYDWQVATICSVSIISAFSATRTFTMSCPNPFLLSELVNVNDVRLYWAYMRYQGNDVCFNVRWRPVGSTSWSTRTVCNSDTYLLGLSSNTAYEWQISTVCPGNTGNSAFTDSRTFTTGSCGVPVIYGWNLNATSAQLWWTLIATPDLFEIQWRVSGSTSPFNSLTTTGAFVGSNSLTGLTPNTAYDVRVRAFCDNGQASAFSNLTTFTTKATCQAATAILTSGYPLTVTAGQVVNLSVYLAGEAPHSFTLSNGQVFSGITTAYHNFTVAPTSSAVYTLTRVSNSCGTGSTSGTIVVTVQTSNTCTAPTNLTETEMTTTNIRLGWQAITGATSYTLQYRETGTTAWTISTPGGSSTGWYVAALLGKTYEWQLQAMCSGGQVSAFSPLRAFTMICPVPFGQTEVLTPTSASLFWWYMSVNGVSLTYNLRWRPVGNPNWTTASNVSSSAYSLTSLTAGQTYEWQIQTICPDGSTTAYTAPRSFTTGCYAPISLTDFNRTSTTTTLNWQFISGVTYAIRWRPTGSANWTLVQGLTSTTYALTGLTNATTYEFQVQSVCSTSESSGFSPSYVFTTACTAPSASVNAIATDRATLTWTNLGAGVRYNLIWRAVGQPTSTTISSVAHCQHL